MAGGGQSQFVRSDTSLLAHDSAGHLAIDNGKTVAWHTLETLAQLLGRHRADDSINKAISKLICHRRHGGIKLHLLQP